MNEVTRILSDIDKGDSQAAERLLPLVYDELRKLAAQRLGQEKPGQTLQATALVHEAYLKLLGDQKFENRGHFFAAAAEAMRRIMVEIARRKGSQKRGRFVRCDYDPDLIPVRSVQFGIVEINDALAKLKRQDPRASELVKLRFFGGLTLRQAAEALNVSPRSADHLWAYARAWLLRELEGTPV